MRADRKGRTLKELPTKDQLIKKNDQEQREHLITNKSSVNDSVCKMEIVNNQTTCEAGNRVR